jgi:hypothetical protein
VERVISRYGNKGICDDLDILYFEYAMACLRDEPVLERSIFDFPDQADREGAPNCSFVKAAKLGQ